LGTGRTPRGGVCGEGVRRIRAKGSRSRGEIHRDKRANNGVLAVERGRVARHNCATTLNARSGRDKFAFRKFRKCWGIRPRGMTNV
jgi:hypothetical protein